MRCIDTTSYRPELQGRLFLDSDSGGHSGNGDELNNTEFRNVVDLPVSEQLIVVSRNVR